MFYITDNRGTYIFNTKHILNFSLASNSTMIIINFTNDNTFTLYYDTVEEAEFAMLDIKKRCGVEK